MSTPVRKIVIQGRRGRKPQLDGNAVYMKLRRAEEAKRRFMCALLIRWGRGFSMEDAPSERNEWTPHRRLW